MRIARSLLLLSLAAPLVGCGGSMEAMAPYERGRAAPNALAAEDREEVDAPSAGGAVPTTAGLAMGARLTESEVLSKKGPDKAPPAQPSPKTGGPGPTSTPAEPAEGTGNTRVTDDRRSPVLIYRADFTMSVYEVQKAIDAVESLAKRSGGYLAKRDDRSITIRVPAGEFQAAVADLSKLGDVLSRNVSAEDVTAEYRDLEVQLANALALRDRYAKLLEKATKVEEALAIEQELGRITGEIERIKGRLKLLGDLAQYSTITVRFSPRVDQQVQEGPFVLPLPWLNDLGLPRLLQLR